VKIVIDGIPIAQARMRITCRGGFGQIYDPQSKEKNVLRQVIKQQNTEFFLHPRISFIFHMPIPKSTPKKCLPLFNSGLLKHEKKPDIDNLVKLYLDCLDGISFEGDQKVQLGACLKLYHPTPKTIILMSEAAQTACHHELDQLFCFAQLEQECDKCSCEQIPSHFDSYTLECLGS